MKIEKDPNQEIAFKRFALIAPLLQSSLSKVEERLLRKEIIAKGTCSDRTLRRYKHAYCQTGIEGLRPRLNTGTIRAISPSVFQSAIGIKKEYPQISVAGVIRILEEKKLITPGEVARSTLGPYLKRLGLTYQSGKYQIEKWMQQVSNQISRKELESKVGDLKDLDKLLIYLRDGSFRERKKAMSIIFHHARIPQSMAHDFLGISDRTYRRYIHRLNISGIEALFSNKTKKIKKIDNESIREKVFTVLHQPPKDFRVNRTSWKIVDLKAVLDNLGYKISRGTISAIVRSAGYSWRKTIEKWMQQVSNQISRKELESKVGDLKDLDKLLIYLRDGSFRERKKAMSIIFHHARTPQSMAHDFIGISDRTYRRYIHRFNISGIEALFSNKTKKIKKIDNESIREKVFTVLHQPPKNFGVNRTSWKIVDLKAVLDNLGYKISRGTISAIVKSAGYSWRKAKVVLTSPDPEYREKLEHIKSILSNLQKDEAFFSIDEYGPFAITKKGGLSLVAPNQTKTVPQWQKSKGSLIITAALELSTNNVTHFYSDNKNTDEMIKLTNSLLNKYNDYKKIYLSWDVASWHVSYKLFKHIEENNAKTSLIGGCMVEIAPLPSGAQFLNIIESVFSGMSRAIIHNSDYQSVKEAKAAIDQYFEERNNYYRENPKRAGNKIWGKERTPCKFAEDNNCKDPRYR